MPFYLRPSAPTATDALICGDPARALTIAQHVMLQPRISNHNRGLWGYYGETPAGRPLTVQATGIGAPSAAAVLSEASDLGLTRLVRVGTCAATGGDHPPLGGTVVVAAARAGDGTSRALGAGEEATPDRGLTAALAAASGAVTTKIASADLLPSPGEHGGDGPPRTPRPADGRGLHARPATRPRGGRRARRPQRRRPPARGRAARRGAASPRRRRRHRARKAWISGRGLERAGAAAPASRRRPRGRQAER